MLFLFSISLTHFGEENEIIDTSALIKSGHKGHGGGDEELIKKLYYAISGEEEGTTTLKESIECHLMGIAAEESRHNGGALVRVHK